jgi:hypothetical protein
MDLRRFAVDLCRKCFNHHTIGLPLHTETPKESASSVASWISLARSRVAADEACLQSLDDAFENFPSSFLHFFSLRFLQYFKFGV